MLGVQQRHQGLIQCGGLQRVQAQGSGWVGHVMGDIAAQDRPLSLLGGLLTPDHRVQIRGHPDRGQRLHRPKVCQRAIGRRADVRCAKTVS